MAELLYFANPMCSWCWGFAPSIHAVRARWPELPVTVITGSMGAERARPMTERDKEYVRHHWQEVAARSGQPFDHSFFDRSGFVYDTAPPCRALLLVRSRFPDLGAAFLEHLQERFYARNEDITDAAVLRDAVCAFGLAGEHFDALFEDPSLQQALEREWQETARLGVSGYPTLIGLEEGRAVPISLGWAAADELVARIEKLAA